MDPLQLYISKRVIFEKEALTEISEAYTLRKVKKKEFILQAGEICHFEAFVTKGTFKLYYLSNTGVEHILYFAVEDWWIADMESFILQAPGRLYIQAIEDSEIRIIYREAKERLFLTYPLLERVFRLMLQRSQIALQHRIINSLGASAEERYLDFIDL